MSSHVIPPSPAEQLEGRSLSNNWTVIRRIERSESATGGHFSTSYIVRSDDGREAFLKAMDYRKALESPDPARALQAMTAAYNFERDVLEKCKSRRLSRVVTVLDSGRIPPQEGDPSGVVEYLIFELASGDVRAYADVDELFETAWALRTTHHAAAALQQLHSSGIAHQDIKPSNLLVFENSHSKLADLGRASDRDGVSPYDKLICAGDRTYAPPELLYRFVPADWNERRLGCDMYLLGSILVFFCSTVSMTHLLLGRIDDEHHYDRWAGTYNEILPYLQREFAQVIRELHEMIRPEFSDDIVPVVNQLCNPDPIRRGHPRNISGSGSQYSLERFVSIFDRLAKRAEYSLTRRVPLQRAE